MATSDTVAKSPYVLIVDDNAEALKLESILFEAAGARVQAADSGEAAIALFKEKKRSGDGFDMIIVDIHMPDPNGYDVALAIRSEGYKGPIIAFTAHVTGRNKTDSRASGITTYLSKASLKKELIAALLHEHCPRGCTV